MGKKKTLRDHAGHLADTWPRTSRTPATRPAPVLADARDKAVPCWPTPATEAVPVLADARDKARPTDARTRRPATSPTPRQGRPCSRRPATRRPRRLRGPRPLHHRGAAGRDRRARRRRRGHRGRPRRDAKRGKAVAAALKGEVAGAREEAPGPQACWSLLGLGGRRASPSPRGSAGRQPTTELAVLLHPAAGSVARAGRGRRLTDVGATARTGATTSLACRPGRGGASDTAERHARGDHARQPRRPRSRGPRRKPGPRTVASRPRRRRPVMSAQVLGRVVGAARSGAVGDAARPAA